VRCIKKIKVDPNDVCLVLGNGPSLKDSFEKQMHFLEGKKKFCMNEFNKSEYYEKIKPDFYVLADPLYWNKPFQKIRADLNANRLAQYTPVALEYYQSRKDIVEGTINNIERKTQWPMTLFLPLQSKLSKLFGDLPSKNPYVSICYYNTTPINRGVTALRYFLYRHNLGMPTPQTVLNSAIFLTLNMGFKKIFLLGADHSFHEDLTVNEKNMVCSKELHFYDTEKGKNFPMFKEQNTGTTFTMHEWWMFLHKMFRSHFYLEAYSKSLNARIYNASERTFLDAYERYLPNSKNPSESQPRPGGQGSSLPWARTCDQGLRVH
jgi:hypothetical protein